MNFSGKIKAGLKNKKRNIAFILCLALVAVTIGGSLTSFAGDSNKPGKSGVETLGAATTGSSVEESQSKNSQAEDVQTKDSSDEKDVSDDSTKEDSSNQDNSEAKVGAEDGKNSKKNKTVTANADDDFLSRFSVNSDGTITGFDVGMGEARYNEKKITIPDTIHGVEITAIGKNAFKELSTSDVTEVVIPSKVKSIGASAFEGAQKLSTLVIPKGTTTLGDRAFAKTGLINVTIPDGVTTVPHGAFLECKKLKTVNLGSGVKKIVGNAFSNASSLSTVVVPEGLEEIEGWAFSYCTSLSKFDFPKNLKKLGIRSFDNCRLTSVDLAGTKVESIEQWCFNGNYYIANVTFPDTLVSIDKGVFENSLFNFTGKKISIVIPSSVKTIGSNAFSGMNNGVLDLRAHFEGAIEGSGWGVRDTTTILWNERSNSCFYIDENGVITGLKPANHSSGTCSHPSFHSTNRNIVIPAQVQSSQGPIDITGVGDGAFQNDLKIKTLSFEDNEKLTKIGENAFAGCNNLKSVKMCDSITSIGDSCFNECSYINEIVWSKNLKTIGTWAFYANQPKNTVLKELVFPDSLEVIGNGSFIGVNPTKIILNEGLKKIDNQAFDGTMNLKTITIPSSVTNINKNAFARTNLEKVYINGGGKLSIYEDSFQADDKITDIYITGRAVDTVAKSAWGAQYANIHWMGETVLPEVVISNDGDWTLNRKTGGLISYNGDFTDDSGKLLNPFTVPSKILDENGTEHQIKKILSGSLKGNSVQLQEVVISEGVTLDTLAVNVFNGVKVKELSLPSTVTSIPFFAFQQIGLEKVNLPKTLQSIGNQAFAGNNLQGTLTIYGKISQIVSDAFNNNPNLTAIYIDAYKDQIPTRVIQNAMFGATNAKLFYKGNVPETSVAKISPNNRGREVVFTSSMTAIKLNFSGFYPDGQPTKKLLPDTYFGTPQMKESIPYSYYENGTYTVMAKNIYGAFPFTFEISDIGRMEINATDAAFSVLEAGNISEAAVIETGKTNAKDLDSGDTEKSEKLTLSISDEDMAKVNALKNAGETTTVGIKATYKDTYPDHATDAKGNSLKGKTYVNTTATSINVTLTPVKPNENVPEIKDTPAGIITTPDNGGNDNPPTDPTEPKLGGGETANGTSVKGNSSTGDTGRSTDNVVGSVAEKNTKSAPTVVGNAGEEVPQVGVGDNKIPLYGSGTWALMNLIIFAVGLILSLIAVIKAVMRRNDEVMIESYYEDNHEATQKKTRMFLLGGMVIASIANAVIFFITQDMSLDIALTDEWTILNALLLLSEILMMVFAFRKKHEDEEAATV